MRMKEAPVMNLVRATEAREAFLNLASLYDYETALHIDMVGPNINEDGMYVSPNALVCANGEREAYVVRAGSKSVGIVGFTEQKDGSHMMDQIFAVKAYRNEEFFRSVLDSYLENKTGVFQCHILKFQEYVQELFEDYFEERGFSVQSDELDAIAWLYTIRL